MLDYTGARKGRLKDGEERVSGNQLLMRLINLLEIPPRYVKYNKTSVTFKSKWGLFARIHVNRYSLRVYFPIRKEKYENTTDKHVNLVGDHKGMLSRISVEKLNEIEMIRTIALETARILALTKDPELAKKH
jgi:hypothetical protein